MKKSELLELILGTIAGFFFGLNIILILSINPQTSGIISSLFNSIKNSRFLIVSSGSMEPAIKVGSAILVWPKETYLPGEVITFRAAGDKKTLVTHRAMIKNLTDGEVSYTTAGDANRDFDRWQIKNEDIVGKVALSVPYLGYLINFAKQPQGFILLVIIPATIVIYEELKSLKRELSKILKGFFRRKTLSNFDGDAPSFVRVASLLPFLGAGLILVAVSGSFFFDKEQSINNILSAATTFPSPSSSPAPTPDPAKTLVINEVLADSSCSQGQTEAQWIEVYNKSESTVNLKNFKIGDGVNIIDLVTANNIEIPSASFALLSHSSAIWNHCYPDNGVIVITANLGGQLNIDTGFLMLFDSNGSAIDTLAWGLGTTLEPLQDESIEREPDGFDSAFGTDFNPSDFAVRVTPTPGF